VKPIQVERKFFTFRLAIFCCFLICAACDSAQQQATEHSICPSCDFTENNIASWRIDGGSTYNHEGKNTSCSVRGPIHFPLARQIRLSRSIPSSEDIRWYVSAGYTQNSWIRLSLKIDERVFLAKDRHFSKKKSAAVIAELKGAKKLEVQFVGRPSYPQFNSPFLIGALVEAIDECERRIPSLTYTSNSDKSLELFAAPGVDWRRKILRNLNFHGANLRTANLRFADFEGADLRGANLKHADLSYANLKGATLDNAILFGTILFEANLDHASIRNANLTGAILWGAELNGTNFNGSDLSTSGLNSAELVNANLSETNLRNATFHKANIEGTKFKGAKNLKQSQIETTCAFPNHAPPVLPNNVDGKKLIWHGKRCPEK
jgi:uncharacterized protein YjbI with pentapeptide repeats